MSGSRGRVVLAGPVFPYRGAISLSTVKLGQELSHDFDVEILSFSRQYPKWFYPGGDDIDPTVRDLAPKGARYALDILNPLTWIREGLRLRRSQTDALVLVWWAWVWAIPYLVMITIAGRRLPIAVQCHNVSDKEPSRIKTFLSNRLFRRANALIVHSKTGADELVERLGDAVEAKTTRMFLPLLPIGREIPAREEAKKVLGLEGRNVALFFGHIRPFKGFDVALRAWSLVKSEAILLVVGEVWWTSEEHYLVMARELGIESRVQFRFGYVPDADVATIFAAADVIVAPYRHEAQSGVAMNAFHFGRAVIASAVGGIPEVIEDGVNGFLVPPEDAAALAAKIDEFFTTADRSALERGVVSSATKYTWERFGLGVRSVVVGLIEGRKIQG